MPLPSIQLYFSDERLFARAKKGCTVEGRVRAALAEEETRFVAKGAAEDHPRTARRSPPLLDFYFYCRLARFLRNRPLLCPPGYVPPADRLRAALPVGTNRAPIQSDDLPVTHNRHRDGYARP